MPSLPLTGVVVTDSVLLDSNFTVKIADFGLSHMRELSTSTMDGAAGAAAGPSDAGKFGIFGTPEWMAPEGPEREFAGNGGRDPRL